MELILPVQSPIVTICFDDFEKTTISLGRLKRIGAGRL